MKIKRLNKKMLKCINKLEEDKLLNNWNILMLKNSLKNNNYKEISNYVDYIHLTLWWDIEELDKIKVYAIKSYKIINDEGKWFDIKHDIRDFCYHIKEKIIDFIYFWVFPIMYFILIISWFVLSLTWLILSVMKLLGA